MTEPVKISMKMGAKGGNPKPVFWTVSDEGTLMRPRQHLREDLLTRKP